MQFRIALITLLLALLFGCTKHTAPTLNNPTAPVKISETTQHAATHYMRVVSLLDDLPEKAHCSATAVSPYTLLTAAHCRTNSNIIYLDKDTQPTKILAEIMDGDDHVLYMVDREFKDYVPIAIRPLVKNEWVHFWGNPGDMRDVFHNGFFNKTFTELDVTFQEFTMGVWGGDSGSGVLDENGNLVAVVSLGSKSSPKSLCLPIKFTEEQLQAAGIRYIIIKYEETQPWPQTQ